MQDSAGKITELQGAVANFRHLAWIRDSCDRIHDRTARTLFCAENSFSSTERSQWNGKYTQRRAERTQWNAENAQRNAESAQWCAKRPQ